MKKKITLQVPQSLFLKQGRAKNTHYSQLQCKTETPQKDYRLVVSKNKSDWSADTLSPSLRRVWDREDRPGAVTRGQTILLRARARDSLCRSLCRAHFISSSPSSPLPGGLRSCNTAESWGPRAGIAPMILGPRDTEDSPFTPGTLSTPTLSCHSADSLRNR